MPNKPKALGAEPSDPAVNEATGERGSALAVPQSTLLVVDDQKLNRVLLARQLEQSGHTVLTASGGREALRMIGEQDIDLVLLDIVMPELSGLEVLNELRKTASPADLPVIMVTSLDASEDVVEALHAGANDYVTKPLDIAVVLARLATQLSLKKARDDVKALNRQLEEAQERIAKLVTSSTEAAQDVGRWSTSTAAEVAQAIGVARISVFAFDRKEPSSLVGDEATGPLLEDLRRVAESCRPVTKPGYMIVPSSAYDGQALGALVIPERQRMYGAVAQRLVHSFARQLGGALELKRARDDLSAMSERRQSTQRSMLQQGIDLLRICPRCRCCYTHEVLMCSVDGAELAPALSFPYRVANRYRLLRVCGEGGMGTVYQAHDERLGRSVALKAIKAECFDNDTVRRRFEHEARAAARIDHPGVVAIFDSGEIDDGSLFIVMEWLDGCDLASLLCARGPGTGPEVAMLLRQAGAALTAAHRAGLVHRDIKPENIFFVPAPDGFRVKIVDFGVAKEVSSETSLTRTGSLVGTPRYMSPEQFLGKSVDYRSDLYSLAAVIYQALSGRRVTLGEDFAEILLDVVQGTPPPISSLLRDIPNAVDQAFADALLKDPAQRPGSVDAWTMSLAAELDQLRLDVPGWRDEHGQLSIQGLLPRDPAAETVAAPRCLDDVPSASGERSGGADTL